jgi:tetratricopeptide (TPR) repeat protein
MGASIAWKTLEKVPVLGSGPGTFFYDFVRYRPSSFESLSIGQLRFVRPDSGFWQLLATYGIAGSLLLGSLVFFAFRNVFPGSSSRSKRRSTLEWPNLPGWMLLWVSLSLLLTSGSMLFTILFWAVLGLSMSAPEAYADGRSVKPKFGLMQGISIAACLVLLGGWYGIVRVWSAPLVAAAAGRAIAATKPLESIGKTIQRAIDLDPWNAGYHMQLAEQKMADLQLRAQSGQSAPTDTIVSDIERAEVFDYQNPAILERSIQLFGELARVRAGAAEMLLARYERLVQVEPSSARNRVEWGKAELLLSQTSKPDETIEVNQELAQSALRHFGQALDLKPGDVDARYHQALAHEVLGDRVAAKAIMRELAVQYPNESDLLYELARQERLDENTDEALRLLNRALEIVPGSIPVRLELARTYEARDEKDKALEILKVIDAARPNTTLITDWIKRLEAEAPAS